jgi:hypothetical protein
MRMIGGLETTLSKHQTSSQNVPVERRPQLDRGGSLSLVCFHSAETHVRLFKILRQKRHGIKLTRQNLLPSS